MKILNRDELAKALELRSKDYKERLDDKWEKVLESHKWSSFYEPLRYATKDGKRIRPLILMLTGESVGIPGSKTDLAAVAVELLHTESIIHDDIIDNQIQRRNKDSFHLRYGNDTALLTADFVFGIILEIASRYNDPRIAKELSSAALKMCEGQQKELNVDSRKIQWIEYLTVISQKTAALFQTSAKLGAIIGGGNENEIDALANYGLNLGIAYQIHDDILDWREDAKFLRLTQDDDIQENIVSLKKLREHSTLYAENAKKQLNKIRESEYKEFLYYLADFTVKRDY
jgi:octaprenyl-diphosphate synthase|tara:strand:+ start:226 stop:1086 length:861 start_codon:yes stop_codon:yes gene_type:complete